MISIIREGSCQSRSSRWAGKSQETSRYGEIWWKILPEEVLDEEARFLLNFEKDMIRKHYGIA